ncbi:MAG: M20 metallopeptidase family protein [Alistipes indistinctus]
MTRQQFEELKAEAWELHGRTVTFRRAIHEHPELSFAEHETARYVSGQLAAEGISFRPIAGTGILAKIEGRGDLSRCVVLRADMDALPIREQTGLPFASRNEGVMHACGHDMHTACLLGALILLNRRRSEIDGTVFGLFSRAKRWIPAGRALCWPKTLSVITGCRLWWASMWAPRFRSDSSGSVRATHGFRR